jgi:hypothetical protein
MAEKDLYSRLKRIFSNNVIVRRIGKDAIKVVDNDALQSSGNINISRYIDRFTRLHGVKSQLSTYNNNYNYYSSKTELYTDYEVMDTDSIINSALDIYADETVMKDEFGQILSIRSDDQRITKILDNLFFDVLNVDFNLWPWVRNMCKYGDFYLKLDIHPEIGVVNVTPMSSYEMIREEGVDPNQPYLVQFANFNYKGVKWENYEVAHFRLLSDSNFLPYGKSMLEGARKVWKQLTLMEDAMLIHRIMRAPERRKFKIDIGNIPPNEVDGYMQKIINQMKKTPFMDEKTGEYNLKFNLQNMLEDFYLPVRGQQSGTEIESLSGMEWTGIDDIEYLRNRMMAGLKVPKAFLGYDESISGKATLAAEDVRFARTIERIQRIVISELTKIAIVHLYAQGFEGPDMINFEIKMTSPSAIYEQEKITLWNSKVDLGKSMMEGKLMSSDFIYKHVFNFTDDEIAKMNDDITKDQKEAFRRNKIAEEGEDPKNPVGKPEEEEGGEDEEEGAANPFGGEEEGAEEGGEETGGEETTTEEGVERKTPEVPKGGWPGAGRPKESTKYGTNRHVRGRDPLGKEELKKLTRTTEDIKKQFGITKIDKVKKQANKIISETKKTDSLLDENQIIDGEI